MPVLSIRQIPAEVHARLRVRAARRGRSMEAEARAILAEACGVAEPSSAENPESLAAWVESLYAGRKPQHVVEDLIAERRRDAATEARREIPRHVR